MKIALCLHGLSGGSNSRGAKINVQMGFESFKPLLEAHQVDVFYHTWNDDNTDYLLNSYQPKTHLIESQKAFVDNLSDLSGNSNRGDGKCFRQRLYSRWYSFLKADELRRDYEQMNNFQYDYVINSRFDVNLEFKIDFAKIDTQSFCALMKGTPFFLSGEGLIDYLFMASSQNMTQFANLYQCLDNYAEPLSPKNNHMIPLKHLKAIGLFDKLRTLDQEEVVWKKPVISG